MWIDVLFLRGRLEAHDDAGLLDGLTRAGYRLVYAATPTEYVRQSEAEDGVSALTYSVVAGDGTVRTVAWEGPAFRAGLAPGARVVTVNGEPFSRDALERAVGGVSTTPVTLTFSVDGQTQEARIDYRGSLRYPRLERIPGAPDRFAALLAPRRGRPHRGRGRIAPDRHSNESQ